MRFGSLFAGIGGMDLGLERAGMRCEWQVEIDDYCNRVLAKHWPDVRRFRDVRECGAHNLPPVDLIAGGFPCQDLSVAGKQAGLHAERSGLWWEFLRIACELRPRYILVENVPALLLDRHAGVFLGSLAEAGFDAEWESVRAADVGAPHRRERVFVIAYPNRERELQPEGRISHERGRAGDSRPSVANPKVKRPQDWDCQPVRPRGAEKQPERCDWWSTEPDVGRVAHGVPARVDRLRGLGNAVVPQVAEVIGRRIMAVAS